MTEHEKEKLFAAVARIEARLGIVEKSTPSRRGSGEGPHARLEGIGALFVDGSCLEGIELMPSRLVESLPDEEGPRWVSRSRRA